MRHDLFLAHLLFGLIVTTAFMALAHVLGDYLQKKFQKDTGTVVQMRALIVLACLLTSLFLFIQKLSNQNGIKISETNEPKLDLFLIKTGGSPEIAPQTNQTQKMDRKNSLTFINQPSAEALSEEAILVSMLRRVNVFSYISDSSSNLCQGWRIQIQNLNVTLSDPSTSSMSDADIIMLCASDQNFSEKLRFANNFVKKGTGLFIVGAIAKKDQNYLKKLLQIESWERPTSKIPPVVSFGGDYFSWGGMPSGLKFGLGADWLRQTGSLLAKVRLGAPLQVKTEYTDQAPLIFSSVGKGRIGWTSLPGHLSNHLNLIYSPYWNIMSARLIAELAGLPLLGAESLPSTAHKFILPVVNSKYESDSALDLSQIFRTQGIAASFSLATTDLAGPTDLAVKLTSQQQEITAIDYFPPANTKDDFFAQLGYFYNWREAKKRILSESQSHPTTPATEACCHMGTTLGSYATPSSIAAAKSVGFDYLIGMPYFNWITPYRLTTNSTASLRDQFLKHNPLTSTGDLVLAIPTYAGSDINLTENKNKLLSEIEIEAWIRGQINDSDWMGGPSVVLIHTHVMGSKETAPLVGKIFGKLKKEGISFLTAKNYLEWWEAKSSLTWNIITPSSNELLLELANKNSNSVRNVRLKLRLNKWKLAGSPANGELNISEIKPNETKRWKLTKR